MTIYTFKMTIPFFKYTLLSILVLRFILLSSCIIIFNKICHIHIHHKNLAEYASFSWFLIPIISFDMIVFGFTHTLIALLMSLCTWYWVVKPVKKKNSLWYVIFGILIGLGILSKYNYLVFLFCLIVASISIDEYKKTMQNRLIFISISCALIISLPYFLWLLGHSDIGLASAHKLNMGESGVLRKYQTLFISLLGFSGVLYCTIRWCFHFDAPQKIESNANLLAIRYLWVLCGFILISFWFINTFLVRWFIPLLFMLPILFFSRVDLQKSNKKYRYWWVCLIFYIASLIGTILQGKNGNHVPLAPCSSSLAQSIQLNKHLCKLMSW